MFQWISALTVDGLCPDCIARTDAAPGMQQVRDGSPFRLGENRAESTTGRCRQIGGYFLISPDFTRPYSHAAARRHNGFVFAFHRQLRSRNPGRQTPVCRSWLIRSVVSVSYRIGKVRGCVAHRSCPQEQFCRTRQWRWRAFALSRSDCIRSPRTRIRSPFFGQTWIGGCATCS